MNTKKILALTIVIIAVFSCMNVASAGLFDFLGGGVQNETYTFDGFTLDLPENANITENTTTEEGYEEHYYDIEWASANENEDTQYITVTVARGSSVVSTIDEFIDNWVSDGAKVESSHGDWSVININGVPIEFFSDYDINFTYSGYLLAQHTGSDLIALHSDDLQLLENVADTYKKV